MSSNKKRLIIRADDLGYSEAVNYGIARAVNIGIVRSVGLMPNMPWAKHGLSLIQQDICLGQHTNICVGKPLSDPKLIPSLVQPNGEFKPSSAYRSAKEDFVDLDEVIIEIEAQYQRFKELTNSEPSYFEGHAVSSNNFFKGLEIVAKNHGLDYFGCAFKEPVTFRNTKVYIDLPISDIDRLEYLKQIDFHEDACELLVLHPGFLDDYILTHSSLTFPRTKEVEFACSLELKQYLSDNDIELLTYDDLD